MPAFRGHSYHRAKDLELRQSVGEFHDGDGQVQHYHSEINMTHSFKDSQRWVCAAHFLSQRTRVQSWLEKVAPRHAILVRTMDDTNVWTCQQGKQDRFGSEESPEAESQGRDVEENDQQEPELGTKAARGLGRKRVCQMLGIVQRLTVRGADNQTDTIRIHVPSQVLAKA